MLCESIDQSATSLAKESVNPERYVGFSLSGLFPDKKMVELTGGERTADAAEEIDIAIKAGGGFRMGPLELRDLVGLDTALHVT